MAEFDDKLNALLSNPDAMSQIMQLANSLSGDSNTPSAPAAPEPPAPRSSGSVLSSLSGGPAAALVLSPLYTAEALVARADSFAGDFQVYPAAPPHKV